MSHQAYSLDCRLEPCPWGRCVQLQRVPTSISPSCLALSQPRLGQLGQPGMNFRPGDWRGQGGESLQVKNSGRPVACGSLLCCGHVRPPARIRHLCQTMFSGGSLLLGSFGQTPSGLSTWGPFPSCFPRYDLRPPDVWCAVCAVAGISSLHQSHPLLVVSHPAMPLPPCSPCRFGELSKDEEDVFNWADTSAPAKFL